MIFKESLCITGVEEERPSLTVRNYEIKTTTKSDIEMSAVAADTIIATHLLTCWTLSASRLTLGICPNPSNKKKI